MLSWAMNSTLEINNLYCSSQQQNNYTNENEYCSEKRRERESVCVCVQVGKKRQYCSLEEKGWEATLKCAEFGIGVKYVNIRGDIGLEFGSKVVKKIGSNGLI